MSLASVSQGQNPYPDRGLGLNLLGIDYERKKQKLQQELQLDYEHFISQTKDRKTSKPCPLPQGLSLPIDERISVKQKLREERSKEYSLFLEEQAQIRKLKRTTAPVTAKPGQVQASDAVKVSPQVSPLSLLNTYVKIPTPRKERPASRRDAATLTEVVDNGKSTGTLDPGYRPRRRWQIYRRKEPYSSEEELNADEEWESDFGCRRIQDRRTQEPEYKEERRTREHKVNRVSQDVKEVEAHVVHDQNSNDRIWKSELQMPDDMRTAARSTPGISKEKREFSTGLMIGATEDQTVAQMKKEQYGQELLRQIAEKQRNKIKERILELSLAASGATEKKLDRIKQLGAVNRQYDSLRQDVPHKPGINLETEGKDSNPRSKDDKPTNNTEQTRITQGISSLDFFSEDYHRDFSNMLGEVAIPRVSEVAPPVPPIVPNAYKTPYDAAYYYYGTRNPLDPNLPCNQNGFPRDVQQSENFEFPFQRPRPLRSSCSIKATHQYTTSPSAFEELHEDKSKQRRESILSYQEALRQQIKENEERKRREKDEEMRYEAKIEAEMMAHNPWGRSGGGAPIKDQMGNLISDLNQMHRSNETSNRNPVEARAPLSHRLSGSNNQTPLQQLHMQDKYQEALKQQMEQKKRKEAEERERIRIEEEKEEKRLARERALIQQEYEDEQKKHKKIEHRLENQSWIHQAKPHHQEEEKKVRQEKETDNVPQRAKRGEEKISHLTYERELSTPIPTLEKRQTSPVVSRPSSVRSQLSSRTECSLSVPHYQPVPEDKPQLDNNQQEVIRQLSLLRSCLRNEQRHLEVQVNPTGPLETPITPPNRRRFREAAAAAAHVNMQNITEFNQLKHRDTASREEIRAVYPDPPTEVQSLDIQQQASLREQECKIGIMNRQKEHNFLGHQQDHYYPRRKPGSFIHRDSLLPSQSAFMDVYSGDPYDQQRSPQPSAVHQERTAPRRRHNIDEVGDSMDKAERDNQSEDESLQSDMSLNLRSKVRDHNHHRIIRQDNCTGDHNNNRAERLSPDEVDVLSLHSALGRRVSVETVATEAWLRPGTADAVKHSGCRETPNSRMDAPPWLTHRVT